MINNSIDPLLERTLTGNEILMYKATLAIYISCRALKSKLVGSTSIRQVKLSRITGVSDLHREVKGDDFTGK